MLYVIELCPVSKMKPKSIALIDNNSKFNSSLSVEGLEYYDAEIIVNHLNSCIKTSK